MHRGLLRNTRPATPGAIIGYRSNGTPIRLLAGGDGTNDAGGSGTPPVSPTPPTPPAPDSTDPAPPAAGDPAKDGAPKTYDEAYVKKLRDEAAANRVKANQLEQEKTSQLDAIAKALGLKKDEADPVKLAEQLAAEQARARQGAVELAVFRTAGKHDGDAEALLDSRGFLASIAELDPAAAGFGKKIEEAIKDAVKNNPKLKAAGQAPAPRSGAPVPGGPGGSSARPTSLHEAVSKTYAGN